MARAFDWQSKGQGFDSPYLHIPTKVDWKPNQLFLFNRIIIVKKRNIEPKR